MSTNSPTKVINSSSTSTLTRMDCTLTTASGTGSGGGASGITSSGIGTSIGASPAASGAGIAGAISPAAARSKETIIGPSSPTGSAPVAASPARISLMRSSAPSTALITVGVAANSRSRTRPSTFSAACATCSSRGRPRKPHVPLMVCTNRKISPSIASSPGARSSFTSARSASARLSFVSVRNSASRSSIMRSGRAEPPWLTGPKIS